MNLVVPVLLFGLLHPMAKMFIQEHQSTIVFCFLFVMVRFLLLLILWLKSNNKGPWKENIKLLTFYGILGLSLQLFEFSGFEQNLPVRMVTFLVFSYQWFILFTTKFINHEPITKNKIFTSILTISGIIILIGDEWALVKNSYWILLPLIANCLLALWVSVSKELNRRGINSITSNFFFDIISVIFLSIMVKNNAKNVTILLEWIRDPAEMVKMIAYSIGVGFFANYLFYKSCEKYTVFTASLALSLEPVLATIIAYVAFDEIQLGLFFYVGALLIIMANFVKFLFKND